MKMFKNNKVFNFSSASFMAGTFTATMIGVKMENDKQTAQIRWNSGMKGRGRTEQQCATHEYRTKSDKHFHS